MYSLQPKPNHTFWTTVTWPAWERRLVLVVFPSLAFVFFLVVVGPITGLACAAFVRSFGGVGWAAHRILTAWVAWPSRTRRSVWAKAAVAYLLTDP